jgi:methylmalonyl-CoA mutase, C-terminal domain
MRRVILAKLGLDGHDVGVRLIGKHLMEAGFEVVYLGKRVSTSAIVRAAVQERRLRGRVELPQWRARALRHPDRRRPARAGADIPVLAGGIDEPAEVEKMMRAGVLVHFGPGTDIGDIVRAFEEAVPEVQHS